MLVGRRRPRALAVGGRVGRVRRRHAGAVRRRDRRGADVGQRIALRAHEVPQGVRHPARRDRRDNRGGFSPVSEPWGAATIEPATAAPAASTTPLAAAAAAGWLGWRAPEWDGGYPSRPTRCRSSGTSPRRGGAASKATASSSTRRRRTRAPPPPPPRRRPRPRAGGGGGGGGARHRRGAAGEYRFRGRAQLAGRRERARHLRFGGGARRLVRLGGVAPPSSAPAPSASPSAPLRSRSPPPPPRGGGGGASGARAPPSARRPRRSRRRPPRAGDQGRSRTATQYDPVHLDDVRLTADGAGGFGARVVARRHRRRRGEEGRGRGGRGAAPPPRHTAAAAAARAQRRILEVQLEESTASRDPICPPATGAARGGNESYRHALRAHTARSGASSPRPPPRRAALVPGAAALRRLRPRQPHPSALRRVGRSPAGGAAASKLSVARLAVEAGAGD